MPGSLAPSSGVALLGLGLLLSAADNGLVASNYCLSFEGRLDQALFFLAFTAATGFAWGVLGWLGGLLADAFLDASAKEGRWRWPLTLLLAGPFAAHGVLLYNAAVDEFREDLPSLALALGITAAASLPAAFLARIPRPHPRADRRMAVALAACALVAGAAFALRLSLPSAPEPLFASSDADARSPSRGSAPLPPGTNVLLILVDTLRADHLSYAGYPRKTSPAIDKLAAHSVRFDQAIGQATRTSPNMASLLTGVTPYEHGIVAAHTALPGQLATWGELLEGAGYHTVGILGNANVGHHFGFTQGLREVEELFRDRSRTLAEPMVRATVQWLEERCREPFFLWLHMIDPHRPYDPPPPYSSWFVGDALYQEEKGTVPSFTGTSQPGELDPDARIEGLRSLADYVARYDGEIRYADHWIGVLLEALDRLDLSRDTLIVFTSDHGESLGEHDYYFSHGTYPYEPTARVPLLFAHPRLPRGQVVDAMVRSIDVLPTVLDLLGLPIPGEVEGRSLRPFFEGNGSGTSHASITTGLPEAVALAARTERWKLILTPVAWPGFDAWAQAKLSAWPNRHRSRPLRQRHYRTELYDLEVDPEELRNLAGTREVAESELRDRILAWVDGAGTRRSAQPVDTRDMDSAVVEQLRELGYVE